MDLVPNNKLGEVSCSHTICQDSHSLDFPAGIHAREWISPATVTYMMNELVTKGSGEFSELLSRVNFYIMPSINPDGYQFTWTDVSG